MHRYMFTERVKEEFRYLVEEYGFSVADERYDRDAFGNSLVDFQSSKVTIRVLLDRGEVTIGVGPYPLSSDYWFDLSSVLEFLSVHTSEPAYVFPEEWDSYDDMVDWQVSRLAHLLQQCCSSVLRGEFTEWKEMDEIRRKKSEDEYRILTGRDPIKITSENARERIRQEERRRQQKQDNHMQDLVS